MVFDPLALVAALTAMAAVVTLMLAFYGNAIPNSGAVRGRLDGLMSGTSVVETGAVALRSRRTGKSLFSGMAPGDVGAALAAQLERADMTIRPGEFVVLRFALALAALIMPLIVVPGVMGFLLGAVAAIVGYNMPKMYMNRRIKKRTTKLNQQLPEALTMISNALKAGFGLLQALSTTSEQMSHPISTELSRTIHEMNIGSSAEVALLALSERNSSLDLDIVVTAILVQRTVGGNLGEILDTVAETMRERIRIRGEIETLTAQQKLTGLVLGFIPIGVGLLFQVMSPGYIDPLFTTLTGKIMLVAAAVMEVIGVMIIQRILDIEV
jgi:tight adherence protein B